jgi:hypothetical protein
MTEEETIKNSFLFMYAGEPIAEFLRESEILIAKDEKRPFNKVHITFEFTFRVPAETFKKYVHHHESFIGKLKDGLHKYHQYGSVLVYLTADWDKLEMVSTEVKPVLTPWQEINAMQEMLLSQIHTASETITFQNVGNTARHLLRKLADIVFEEHKQTPPNNKFDLGPECYKNRLWAFVLYKVPGSSTGHAVREYAESLLQASDKAIALSNSVTHALNADAFLAQSCAISALTTVHFIKLVFDRPDPQTGAEGGSSL